MPSLKGPLMRNKVWLIATCGVVAVLGAGCGNDSPPATTTSTVYVSTTEIPVPVPPGSPPTVPGSIPGSVPGSIPGSIPAVTLP